MKRYLNSEEKTQLSVLFSIRKYLNDLTNIYTKVNESKVLIKWLRSSHTFITKVIEEKLRTVDAKNTEIALRAGAKLRLVARTKEEAIREIEELNKLDSQVSIPKLQFQNMCSFALVNCQTCIMNDYENCSLRDTFMEYDIDPLYPFTNKCQYQHTDIKENACFNVYKNNYTDELIRLQPGAQLKGYTLYRSAPLPEEFWQLPKVTVD